MADHQSHEEIGGNGGGDERMNYNEEEGEEV